MIDFNQATKLLSINYDREEFYYYVKKLEPPHPGKLARRPLDEWARLYQMFDQVRKENLTVTSV